MIAARLWFSYPWSPISDIALARAQVSIIPAAQTGDPPGPSVSAIRLARKRSSRRVFQSSRLTDTQSTTRFEPCLYVRDACTTVIGGRTPSAQPATGIRS
jgi:hypothetical protein